jgi:hypothetical protein
VVWQAAGEYPGAVLGDGDRVLGVGGARAVGRADGPAVGVEDDPVGETRRLPTPAFGTIACLREVLDLPIQDLAAAWRAGVRLEAAS